MTGPLPQILGQPLIPTPLHGLNPRSIMGRAKWDVMRRQVYAKYGHTCAARGVRARDAKLKKYLEAHESFEINCAKKQMTLNSMEPLCHACHASVHTGLLDVKLQAGEVDKEPAVDIPGHGACETVSPVGKLPPAPSYLCRKYAL